MALNTQNRRMAALGASLLFRVVPPVPDGTIFALDRLHLLALFRFGQDVQVGGPPSISTLPPIGALVLVTVSGPAGGLVTDDPPIGRIQ